MKVIAIVAATSAGCASTARPVSPSTSPNAVATGSPLEIAWEEKQKKFEPGRNFSGAQFDLLKGEFSSIDHRQQHLETRRLYNSVPQLSPYEQLLLQVFSLSLIDRGDDAELTRLLASHCPRLIARTTLEYLMVARGSLSNPIKVLVDAFRDAPELDNKGMIIGILANAFPDLAASANLKGIALWHVRNAGDDVKKLLADRPEKLDAFATSCLEWYSANRSKVRVHDRYESNDSATYGVERGGLFEMIPGGHTTSPR